jgi:type IV pilus assembly protein PilB
MPAVARLRIGELLVAGKVISDAQLEGALAQPREAGQRIGDVLVQMGLVNETQLTQTLSQQLSVPWVSLYHIDFSRQLLDLVPREVADRCCLVPVFVRKARKRGDTLYVAMDDPTNEQALEAVSQFAGLPTRPMIASKSDIRNAIRVYYSMGEAPPTQPSPEAPPSAPALPPSPPPPPPPRARPAPEPSSSEPPPVSQPPDSLDSPDAAPSIEAQEMSLPPPKQGRKRPMIALTLLDGTTIQLPSRKGAAGAPAPSANDGGLTARDLISALRAVSHGADATEILGEEAKWQSMFAALLSLMLRKGLIADWEFVEEYRKI